jgi:riboflavin-specific deaminase-like protein
VKRKTKIKSSKLPFILVNMAMTADGKIATANRAISTFGSQRDHEHLLELRATADAVMAGATTVNSAPVNLGPGATKFQRLRLERGLAEYNLRVVVSGSGSIDPNANLFKKRFSPIIILTTARISKVNLQKLRAVSDEVKICDKTEINFRAALRWLRKKWNVQRLLCEGGGELNGSLFRADLVDELHLTICPKIFGGCAAPTIADGKGIPNLAAAARFKLKSANRVGDELFAVFKALKSSPL